MAEIYDNAPHDPYVHFSTLASIQNQLTKQGADIAAIEAKLNLLSPKDINQLQLDVNNLQNKDDLIQKDILNTTQDLTSLTNDLNTVKQQSSVNVSTINGQINQLFLGLSDCKKEIKQIKEDIEKRHKSFFSSGIQRDVLVGVITAIVLSILMYMFGMGWDVILDRQTNKRNPQITLVDKPTKIKNLPDKNDK